MAREKFKSLETSIFDGLPIFHLQCENKDISNILNCMTFKKYI